MITEPIHVTDAAFQKSVLDADLPVIVDFWAPWCGPCKMVAPTLDKLAKEYAGKVLIAKVNTDDNPEWAQKYHVQGIPTMLFIANGKVVHQQVGALPEPMLRSVLDQFLSVAAEDQA
ncbi:MAG: thioredoxin [Anaerolineales bacterium]|nr:thioredoxin [Anaerolineales bacterium]